MKILDGLGLSAVVLALVGVAVGACSGSGSKGSNAGEDGGGSTNPGNGVTPDGGANPGNGVTSDGGANPGDGATSDGGDSGGPSHTGVAGLDDFCTNGITQVCQKQASCGWIDPDYVSTCVAAEQVDCARMRGYITAGAAEFDGVSAKACALAITQASCDAQVDLQSGVGPCTPPNWSFSSASGNDDVHSPPGLTALFTYSLAKTGDPCSNDQPCTEGYCPTEMNGQACAVCTPYGKLGDSCASDKPCEYGTWCSGADGGTGTCAATKAGGASCLGGQECTSSDCNTQQPGTPGTCTVAIPLGGACNADAGAGDPYCAPYLACRAGVCAPTKTAGPGMRCQLDLDCQGAGLCENGACVVPPVDSRTNGQRCTRISQCAPGLTCDFLHGNVCIARSGVGNACSSLTDTSACVSPAQCYGYNNMNDSCVVPQGAGAACDATSTLCRLFLSCSGNGTMTCQGAGPRLGEACDPTQTNNCLAGYCHDLGGGKGECRPFLAIGAACTSDPSQGTCPPPNGSVPLPCDATTHTCKLPCIK